MNGQNRLFHVVTCYLLMQMSTAAMGSAAVMAGLQSLLSPPGKAQAAETVLQTAADVNVDDDDDEDADLIKSFSAPPLAALLDVLVDDDL